MKHGRITLLVLSAMAMTLSTRLMLESSVTIGAPGSVGSMRVAATSAGTLRMMCRAVHVTLDLGVSLDTTHVFPSRASSVAECP